MKADNSQRPRAYKSTLPGHLALADKGSADLPKDSLSKFGAAILLTSGGFR